MQPHLLAQIDATVSELDLAEYIRASWYAQQQQLVGSQSESDLNCVAATYELEDRKVPGFDGPVVTAYNHARRDSFLGPRTNVTLCARAAFALRDARIACSSS